MTILRCYYEVLECERDATPDEIKLKYRKLALKWHPGILLQMMDPTYDLADLKLDEWNPFE
jgi:preprotein translocase subunit Sec63